jgi:hypothetical protein
MELTTPDGFARQSWESGYGDYLPGRTGRRPGASRGWSGRRWCWPTRVDEATGEEVAVAPRTILRRQIDRAAALGLRPKMASELEFYLFRDTYEQAHAKGYVGLERSGWYSEDYQIFQSTKAEPLYRQLRTLMTEAGVPVEFSKGEARAGAARGQHPLRRRPGGRRPPHPAQARRQGDRPSERLRADLHGQAGGGLDRLQRPRPPSLWDPAGERNLFSDPGAELGMSQDDALVPGRA